MLEAELSKRVGLSGMASGDTFWRGPAALFGKEAASGTVAVAEQVRSESGCRLERALHYLHLLQFLSSGPSLHFRYLPRSPGLCEPADCRSGASPGPRQRTRRNHGLRGWVLYIIYHGNF